MSFPLLRCRLAFIFNLLRNEYKSRVALATIVHVDVKLISWIRLLS